MFKSPILLFFPSIFSLELIWPQPKESRYGEHEFSVTKGHLKIIIDGFEDCEALQIAKNTYENSWFFPEEIPSSKREGQITSVRLIKPEGFECPKGYSYPKSTKEESYHLIVNSNSSTASLTSPTVYGFLRGLESFSQLIQYKPPKTISEVAEFTIREAEIIDEPAYGFRGLMLDTGRHYLPVDVILRQIDLMAQTKFNLFHWHIVDVESFPYQSEKFPNLSALGAFGPSAIYTKENIQKVIKYANLRGIRVVPEFDSPGHMGSWLGQSKLLADCGEEKSNILDPSRESNYQFLQEFFTEVIQLFPDPYIHLGGDEVTIYEACWKNNRRISRWAQRLGLYTVQDIEQYYYERLIGIIDNITKELNVTRTILFWEEAVLNLKKKHSNVVAVPWWRYESMTKTTEKGFPSINAACYYVNYLMRPKADWRVQGQGPQYGDFYHCHPKDYVYGGHEELNLGGIATMWGEYEDKNNLESDLWPRTATVAEKLWSPYEKTKDPNPAIPRLHRLRCRMNWRGFRASPTDGSDYCAF